MAGKSEIYSDSDLVRLEDLIVRMEDEASKLMRATKRFNPATRTQARAQRALIAAASGMEVNLIRIRNLEETVEKNPIRHEMVDKRLNRPELKRKLRQLVEEDEDVEFRPEVPTRAKLTLVMPEPMDVDPDVPPTPMDVPDGLLSSFGRLRLNCATSMQFDTDPMEGVVTQHRAAEAKEEARDPPEPMQL